MLIALDLGSDIGGSLFADAELGIALGARRDFQNDVAVDGRHFDIGSQCRLREGDGDGDDDVIAFPDEDIRRGDVENDV